MAEITENTKKILEVILNLKEGEVMSYRDVAHLAGLSNGARQVSRVLHSMSKKYGLPWWRVVRSDRTIGL
ncbi:cysteine methyltransferase, partial [Streptococcus thermophilus]|nr:cysteine methyltransferase [Streptococcus thermophilus]